MVGFCSDGASNMLGINEGLGACCCFSLYGYRLALVAKDSIKLIAIVNDVTDTLNELITFIYGSSKRKLAFEQRNWKRRTWFVQLRQDGYHMMHVFNLFIILGLLCFCFWLILTRQNIKQRSMSGWNTVEDLVLSCVCPCYVIFCLLFLIFLVCSKRASWL